MGLWSRILSWGEFAEDSLGEPVHIGDLLTPAIWEYDARGLRFNDWKPYQIDPGHLYRVLKLQKNLLWGGCQACLRDVSGNCCDTPLVPTHLFEKIPRLEVTRVGKTLSVLGLVRDRNGVPLSINDEVLGDKSEQVLGKIINFRINSRRWRKEALLQGVGWVPSDSLILGQED